MSNNGGGVLIGTSSAGASAVLAVLNRVQVDGNVFGIKFDGTSGTGAINATLRDSLVAGNSGNGKDLVISGGFNVYPKEIESEIDAMPGVVESVVIGLLHANFGEGVTAVVVCNPATKVSEASVLLALDGRTAKFKMPKRVFIVDDLPRNAMGKVQKNVLRDTYSDIYTKK